MVSSVFLHPEYVDVERGIRAFSNIRKEILECTPWLDRPIRITLAPEYYAWRAEAWKFTISDEPALFDADTVLFGAFLEYIIKSNERDLLRAWQSRLDIPPTEISAEPEEPEISTEEIQLVVVGKFAPIEAVAAVYFDWKLEALSFKILLDRDRYDNQLMDELLDREIEVLESFPEKVFDFSYLPTGSKEYFVSPQSRLVYEKSYGNGRRSQKTSTA